MARVVMREVTPERIENEEYSLLFKLCLYGCVSVGKTTTVAKFIRDEFDPEYVSTIGIDFVMKTVEIDSKDLVKLQLWDCSGQEKFRLVTSSYFRRGAHGIILFFDLTNRESFEKLPLWINELQQDAPENLSLMLAGAKSDLEDQRVVTNEEIAALAKGHGVEFIEISAKTGDNVHTLFEMMVEKMMQAQKKSARASGTTEMPLAGHPSSSTTRGQSDSRKTCVLL